MAEAVLLAADLDLEWNLRTPPIYGGAMMRYVDHLDQAMTSARRETELQRGPAVERDV
jgi:hypothetical protein